MKEKALTVIIALICCTFAIFLQETNLFYLEKESGNQITLISTADEASYLRPPQNYLEGKDWKDSSTGVSSYIQRPPGYGLIFMFCKLIYPSNPLILLKFLQIAAFFFSIILVYKILRLVVPQKNIALSGMLVFGLLPCYSGFMYFTLTEAVSPFFLLITAYAFISTVKNLKPPYLLAISVMFLLLIRPQLIIFPLLFIPVILTVRPPKWAIYFLAFLPFLAWQIRSYSISEEVSIHPIYSSTNKSIFRPPHLALTDLFRLWEYKSDRFHNTVGELTRDTSSFYLEKSIENIPERYRAEVRPVLREFQYVTYKQKRAFNENESMKALPSEKIFVHRTDSISDVLFKKYPLEGYLLTPIKSGVELFSKSHLNLWVFQKKWRGNVFMEALRWGCLIIINLSLLAALVTPFVRKVPLSIKVLATGIIITVFYYVWIQRLNEERYMTPLLPLMLICLFVAGHHLMKRMLAKTG